MRTTAVPDDHLMHSKFRIAGHMDYSGEICRDKKPWLFCQSAVSDIPKRAYGVIRGSMDIRSEFDYGRKHKPGCEATNECFAATIFALRLSISVKDNFAALITPSD
jgi:hypothetical protein